MNGGQLRVGNPGNKGGGRPKNELREKLRGIAHGKGLPFLAGLLDGEIPVQFVGTCPHCHQECEISESEEERLEALVDSSIDQRLKANEQALKYGVGTQNESLNEEQAKEGRAMLNRIMGRMYEALRAAGVASETIKAAYAVATEGESE